MLNPVAFLFPLAAKMKDDPLFADCPSLCVVEKIGAVAVKHCKTLKIKADESGLPPNAK